MERNSMYKNGIPQFDGQKYAFWSRRVKTCIQEHGFEIWQWVVNGYKEPTVGLHESVYAKVVHCKSAKEIWEKLENIYEGDSRVKETKLQTYRGQFEQLKMKEDDNIATYFLQVDETINAIIGLWEEIKEYVIVQKVLLSQELTLGCNRAKP